MPPKKTAGKKSTAKKSVAKKSAKKAAPKVSAAKKVAAKKSVSAKKAAPKAKSVARSSLKSSATASSTSFGEWYWEGDRNGTFIPFNTITNQTIEEAYEKANGTGVVSLTYNNWSYKVDFDNMVQENVSTGRRRQLKREVKKASSSSTGKEKMTASGRERMVMKGRGVVDPLSGKVSSCHVYDDGQCVYQCTLNQTNVTTNNNKFYVLQLLQEDGNSLAFYLFTRWGRVGVDGSMMTETFTSLSAAVAAFKSKFRSKTSNDWDNRDNFTKVAGKYQLMQIDYSGTVDDDNDDGSDTKAALKRPKMEEAASVLDPAVQNLMKIIGSKEAMNMAMKELDIDVKRMPLGKISKQQIKEAYGHLSTIEAELKKPNPNVQLPTDLFYTLIPHDFGFRRPPLINSEAMLKEKREMLEMLSDLEIASKLLDDSEKKGDTAKAVKHHLDRTYESLKCTITPVSKNSEVFKHVQTYVTNTKGKTHNMFKMEVEQVFEIHREGEEGRYKKHYGSIHNKQMLWHGSRTTNFMGILSQGLRIAPPEAPCTGYMFGKGIYFADVCSKSANYCNTTRSNNTGLMLLAEVALGSQKEYTAAHYVTKLDSGCHSVKGIGQMFPDPAGAFEVDGVKWPAGKMAEKKTSTSLLYPEHIIYDVNQCQLRYLVQMKFKYN